MNVIETNLPGVKILEPKIFGDERGFFFESYNKKTLERFAGITPEFVQDNHSRSVRGVLRGLHYQIQNPQAKLVRVVIGEVFDVAVDLRKHSPTFGQWTSVILTEKNKRMLWVPEGFAHGFLVLSDSADFVYKTTAFYDPTSERCLAWNDLDVGIDWPLNGEQPILSPKDCQGISLRKAEVFL